MKPGKVGRRVSSGGLHGELAEGGCVYMCGMCPTCILAPEPPASIRCQWRASDEFKRRFMVELLLRCKSIHVLESIQSVLSVTSWSLFTYDRSRRPLSPQDYPSLSDRTLLDGKPQGLDLNEIWDWLNSRPDWMQSRYLCSLLSLCDSELLRMLANLTSVLLVRQKRGFLQFNASSSASQRDQVRYGDPEEPALMVVPGTSKSMSGVSRYKDFIGCLPVHLSKRILGLLHVNSLRRCNKVCQRWQHLAQETATEVKFSKKFRDEVTTLMKRYKSIKLVNSTYANIVDVPIPVKDDEKVDILPSVQKFKTFEAAYAKIGTKMVEMEERNVYCSAFYTTVLLDKEDAHRAVDYKGGLFMAMGSRDRTVHVLYVASQTKVVSVMKGHVGGIRVVLLCEDRSLLITGSHDASIRCWCLKTDMCVMTLYGHSGTVNCLDVLGDRLVSGSKDCQIKGKLPDDFHFKHSTPVQCVKLKTTRLYSSCDQGLVKVWDMETASLLKVIEAHRSSSRCLFVDEWHLLSTDSNGLVKAWSVNCDVKDCLMTFNHPKEVKSLTLVYLRVVTGCVDGKIRIFNFLTGECLREITAEAESGRLLSLHFLDYRILVNTTYTVKLYQFAKVFWEYAESTKRDRGEGVARDSLVSRKSSASLRKLLITSVGADHSQKIQNCSNKQLCHACSLPTQTKAQSRERCETAEQSVMLSEKATSEWVKKRGPHHPLTQDSILLKINAIQKRQCMDDEVSINMESNARLRDNWGPQTSQDDLKQSPQTQTCHTSGGHSSRPATCVPILKRGVGQNMTEPRSTDTHRATKRVSVFTTSATGMPPAPEYHRSLPNLERSMKSSTSLPRISPAGPLRQQGGLTGTQLEDGQAKKDLKINAIQKGRCKNDEVSINTESNARLRDSRGPQTSQNDLKQSPQTQTCHTRPATVPILKKGVGQNMTQPPSADTHRATNRVSGFTTSATEVPPAPEYHRSLPNLERSMKSSTSLPRISPMGPLREQGGLTGTQLEDGQGINMESNARLRDSRGPQTSQDDLKQSPQTQTCNTSGGQSKRPATVPILKRGVGQNMTQPRSADTHKRVSVFTTSATEGPPAPEYHRSLPNLERSMKMKSSTSLPRISPVGPLREQGRLTGTQLEDGQGINTERNARLRDSRGPQTSQDDLKQSPQTQTCHTSGDHSTRPATVPILKRGVGQNMTQPRSADTRKRVSVFPTSAAEGPPAPEYHRSLPNLERSMKSSTGLPRISPVGPLREQGGLTGTQIEDGQAKKDLKINAIQKRQRIDDEVSMESNARLRDSRGLQTSRDDLKQSPQTQTCHTSDAHSTRPATVPILKRGVSHDMTHPRSADTRKRVSVFTTSAAEGPPAPEYHRSLPNLERSMKSSTSLPRISPVGPLREQGGLTGTQLQDGQAKKDLKINAIQKRQCMDDEVSINTESNARLRDSRGPQTSRDDLKQSPQTQTLHTSDGHSTRPATVPILKRGVSQNMTQPRSADTGRATKRVSVFTTSATEGPPAPEYHRSLPNLERQMKSSTSSPRISPVGPLREQGGLTGTQLEDGQAKKDLKINAIQKRQCIDDEVSINMESNARLRDSRGPQTSQDDLKQSPQTQTCHTSDGHSTRPATVPILKRGVPNLERSMKSSTSLPRISPVGPLREQGGLTGTQLEDGQAKKDLTKQKPSKRNKKQEKKKE